MIIAFAECSLGWEVRKLVSRTLPGRWRGRSWCYGDFSTTIFRATTNSTAFIDSDRRNVRLVGRFENWSHAHFRGAGGVVVGAMGIFRQQSSEPQPTPRLSLTQIGGMFAWLGGSKTGLTHTSGALEGS